MRFSSRSSALQHTVFENRRKVSFSKITCGQTVLPDKSTLKIQKTVENETFWVIFKQCVTMHSD